MYSPRKTYYLVLHVQPVPYRSMRCSLLSLSQKKLSLSLSLSLSLVWRLNFNLLSNQRWRLNLIKEHEYCLLAWDINELLLYYLRSEYFKSDFSDRLQNQCWLTTFFQLLSTSEPEPVNVTELYELLTDVLASVRSTWWIKCHLPNKIPHPSCCYSNRIDLSFNSIFHPVKVLPNGDC